MDITNHLAALESEGSLINVSKEDVVSRYVIANALRSLPKEVVINLRHILPQAGCLNNCSFCSQSAAHKVWQLTERALKNLFSALKTVAIGVAQRYLWTEDKPYLVDGILSPDGVFRSGFTMPSYGLVGYDRENHRPGVIYPYLDNDVASYPFFLQYIKFAGEDLGVKVRLSTVGYSRRNAQLQKMHEEINRDYLNALAGVRLSVTPYTLGWTTNGERSKLTSRDDFTFDMNNFLNTYKPAISSLGTGDRAASVEFRFPPLIVNCNVEETVIDGRHVIHCGPYLLISDAITGEIPTFYPAKVKIDGRHSMAIDEWFSVYTMIISSTLEEDGAWERIAKQSLVGKMQNLTEIVTGVIVRKSKLYQLQNDEGQYYAVDPGMTEFGYFAKEFYPCSDSRILSGYIDSERYFLNAILKYKRTKGIGRKELFHNASSEDVLEVLTLLERKIARMNNVNPPVAQHLKRHVLPLVVAYAKALETAGFPAKYFFDKNFTIDTGETCNLGGAYHDYRALTMRKNSVVTPQHERVYSSSGSLATEGKVWVIGVAPMSSMFRNGGIPPSCPALYVEEQDMTKRSSVDGYVLRRWYIPLKDGDVEVLNASHHKDLYLIPGRSA